MNENCDKPMDLVVNPNSISEFINNDRLLKSYYGGIGEVIQNQQYKIENNIVEELMKKYSIENIIYFDIKTNKQIENKILEYTKNISTKILLYRDDFEENEIYCLAESEIDNCFFLVRYAITKNSIILYFTIFGNNNFNLENFECKINSNFNEYLLKNDNSMISISYYLIDKMGSPINIGLSEQVETEIKDINYPFIENIDKLIENYNDSKSSILFLMGAPGTGKTRFIRYLLSKLCTPDNYVFYTSDTAVINHGGIFTDFLQSKSNLMVLEDFDFHLNSRKDGNVIMYHLLGSSDGLIQSFNKKIIISTNLPNLQNIDEAIIRKGRCFDILNFRLLLWDEVINFFKSNNFEEIINKIEEKEYTLADLYYILNTKDDKKIETYYRKAGFK